MSPGYRSLLEIGLGGLVLGGLLAFVFFAPRVYFWSWLLVFQHASANLCTFGARLSVATHFSQC